LPFLTTWKKNPSSLPPTRKKREPPSLHDMASHWFHGNTIPKTGCHYFWPGLIALPTNIFVSWGCLTSPTSFFFAMSQFDSPIAKKSWNYGASQNRRFYEKMECLPFWPTYIGEKGRILGKTCWIKARCYWEHPWGTHWKPREHIGNLMGIHWELEGNMLGTKGKWKFFDWNCFKDLP
jgi:hypothetical protein